MRDGSQKGKRDTSSRLEPGRKAGQVGGATQPYEHLTKTQDSLLDSAPYISGCISLSLKSSFSKMKLASLTLSTSALF